MSWFQSDVCVMECLRKKFYSNYLYKLRQRLNYSARGGGSIQARGLKGQSLSPKDREQTCGSRPPTMGFRAFKALCLAFMAFKYPHQASTDANDKMTVKDYIFYKTLCICRKILNIITVQSVDPNKKVPDLNCGVQDLLLEVVDLK